MTSSHPLWWEDVTASPTRPRLSGSLDADVVVVGAGYTGLWTARELLRRDPHLRVVVVEAQHVGFGASGRNGGWASALFPVSLETLSAEYSVDHALALTRHLTDAVVELGRALDNDGIGADFVRGGTLTFARGAVQEKRLRAEVSGAHQRGLSDDDIRWLSAREAESRARIAGSRGAMFSPHCARLHPAKLVHGLAKTVEDLGATLYELSPVTRILPSRPGRRPEVVTLGGRVRADVVVQATEGYTPSLGPRRTIVPLYSLMIATEPLSPEWWDHHGLRDCETFADGRHLIIYGQRTADHRLAFGGRGAPYHFGSGVDPRFDEHAGVFTALAETLRELFPDFDADITHRWGGPLAMPRDHFPRVSFDPSLGIARVGGYTGDGVTMSFVMGRLLATLLLHPDELRDRPEIDILTRAPRLWEIEPLRFLGINAGLWLAEHTDRAERAGRDSRAGRLLERLW